MSYATEFMIQTKEQSLTPESQQVRVEVLRAYREVAYDNEYILASPLTLYTEGYYGDFFNYYEMVLGYMEEEYSMFRFGKRYEQLDDGELEMVREAIMDGMEETVEDRMEEILTEECLFFGFYRPSRIGSSELDYSEYTFINSPLVGVW